MLKAVIFIRHKIMALDDSKRFFCFKPFLLGVHSALSLPRHLGWPKAEVA